MALRDRVNVLFPVRPDESFEERFLRDPTRVSSSLETCVESGRISGCPIVPATDPDAEFGLPDDSSDECWPAAAPHALEDIVALNETIRGGAPGRWSTVSSWSQAWFELIRVVRSAPTLVFCDIFSGTAGLTCTFVRHGWACAPPIDIMFNSELNCLDPGFVGVLVGLILEGRVRLLHLGPPCSSFSMAVNRFPHYAMRSRDQPAGFTDLCP